MFNLKSILKSIIHEVKESILEKNAIELAETDIDKINDKIKELKEIVIKKNNLYEQEEKKYHKTVQEVKIIYSQLEKIWIFNQYDESDETKTLFNNYEIKKSIKEELKINLDELTNTINNLENEIKKLNLEISKIKNKIERIKIINIRTSINYDRKNREYSTNNNALNNLYKSKKFDELKEKSLDELNSELNSGEQDDEFLLARAKFIKEIQK